MVQRNVRYQCLGSGVVHIGNHDGRKGLHRLLVVNTVSYRTNNCRRIIHGIHENGRRIVGHGRDNITIIRDNSKRGHLAGWHDDAIFRWHKHQRFERCRDGGRGIFHLVNAGGDVGEAAEICEHAFYGGIQGNRHGIGLESAFVDVPNDNVSKRLHRLLVGDVKTTLRARDGGNVVHADNCHGHGVRVAVGAGATDSDRHVRIEQVSGVILELIREMLNSHKAWCGCIQHCRTATSSRHVAELVWRAKAVNRAQRIGVGEWIIVGADI